MVIFKHPVLHMHLYHMQYYGELTTDFQRVYDYKKWIKLNTDAAAASERTIKEWGPGC